MFGFGKKKENKPPKDRKGSGVKHGLGFTQNNLKWVVGLDGESNILITGSDRIEVGNKIVKALEDLNGKVRVLSNNGIKSPSDDQSSYDLDDGLKVLHDSILSSISSGIMSEPDDAGADDYVKDLFVIEDWESVLRKDSSRDPLTSAESNGESHDGLYDKANNLVRPALSDEEYGKVNSYIDGLGVNDDASKSALLLALVIIHGQSSNSASSITLESISHDLNDSIAWSVGLLLSQGADEDLNDYAGRIKYDHIARSIAPFWLKAGPGTGLNVTPSGWPADIDKAVSIINSDYDAFSTLEGKSRRFMSHLLNLLAIANAHGLRVLLVADGGSSNLMALLPNLQTRVIAGAIRPEDRWMAGSDIGRALVNPRPDVITVFSVGVQSLGFGRAVMKPSSMISPEFLLDRLDVSLV
jgi:hypothetical protein